MIDLQKTKHLRKRYRQEKRFHFYGIAAIAFSLFALGLLVFNVLIQSRSAFMQSYIQLDLDFHSQNFITSDQDDALAAIKSGAANFSTVLMGGLQEVFPEVTTRQDKRALKKIISNQGARMNVRDYILAHPEMLDQRVTMKLLASDDVDQLMKDNLSADSQQRFSDKQISWIRHLVKTKRLTTEFNFSFLTTGDSSSAELAGIWGAVVGSFFTMMVTLFLSFPLAVAAGVYLEEFAPRNRWTDFIEVNINNLAAVPSIIFGLLGLAIFIQWFSLPRSAPLVGGMVLTLMTLPTIIIATRVSLKSVPYSIREAALGLGASTFQAVFHHALPLAMPGVLTGTIIGMARALGETAPLLMIGMVAFIVDVPQSPLDSATALPVQIFLWADKPERGFVAKTAAAILILLVFLIIMNATAIYLRKKFEKKW